MKAQIRSFIARRPAMEPIARLIGDAQRWRDPDRARRVFADARQTWSEAAFARDLPPPVPGAPAALILSMSDYTYSAKLESMLALALRRRGWRVQILTSPFYSNARRIFSAYGLNEFVAFEALLSDADAGDEVSVETSRRRNEAFDFQSVLRWTYRDCWIGPQILSSISRQVFDGAPDPRDPHVREMLLAQLPTTLKFVHAAEKWLAEHQPALIIVNEPNFHTNGPFVDVAVARGISVIHFTQPSREDALIFKRLTHETRRIHPNSISRQTLERRLGELWTTAHERRLMTELDHRYNGTWKVQARNQPETVAMSADDIRKQLGLAPHKPTAVVFSHVLWDANLFYGDDLFENYGHWFIETIKAACRNPRLNWIVKLHPANIWKRKYSGVSGEYTEVKLIRESVGELPAHVKLLPAETEISTLSLFRMIDAGITVRGSIGYELPCLGVPVITAGTGRYSGFGFTIDHSSREAYLATLDQLEAIPRLSVEETHRAKVHAYALFVLRPWFYTTFRSVIGEDATDPLYQNLIPMRGRGGGRINADDLDAFAGWAQGDEVDYLNAESAATASPPLVTSK